MASSKSVLLPSQLEPKPAARSKVGKNAKNKLKAIAWDMMPQRGNTRANTFHTRFAKSDLASHAALYLLLATRLRLFDVLPGSGSGSSWFHEPLFFSEGP
jgi:hypothetical protein